MAGALSDSGVGPPFCHITGLLRQPETADGRDTTLAARVAALTASGALGESVLCAWIGRYPTIGSHADRSTAPGVVVDLLFGGTSIVKVNPLSFNPPGVDRDESHERAGLEARVSVAPGSEGRALAAGDFLAAMSGFAWNPLGGVVLADEREPRDDASYTLEDALLRVWAQPFSWVVIGRPVDGRVIADSTSWLNLQLPRLATQRDNSGEDAAKHDRAVALHRTLTTRGGRGVWHVWPLAGIPHLGGESIAPEAAAAARGLGALLGGTGDVLSTSSSFVPGDVVTSLSAAVTAPGPSTEVMAALIAGRPVAPALLDTESLARLFRVPTREIPGLQQRLAPTFDITREAVNVGKGAGARGAVLTFGSILTAEGASAGPLQVNTETLKRHTFVCGATGSGKSETVRTLLEALSGAGIPWLVIEPAKAEYRVMAERLANQPMVFRIRPGEAGAPAVGINPLEPSRDPRHPGRYFPLQTHADLVRALFQAAFQADAPFPQVLAAGLQKCYEEQGWDLTLAETRIPGGHPRFPTLADLQRAAREVVTEIGYGEQLTRDMRGFVDVRLGSLRRGTPGRFLDGGHPLDLERLLASNVVLELEDIGDDLDKAFVMGIVLIRVAEHLRMLHGQDRSVPLCHVLVIEEAHRLLRRVEGNNPAAHAIELFANLLAEVRAYGQGVIVAEQIPSKIAVEVIKNTALKIVHRLPAQDDRDLVGATMNMTEPQSQYVVSFREGEAAVAADKMDFPVRAKMFYEEIPRSKEEASLAVPTARCASSACPPTCRSSPCTLAQLRRAELLLADCPDLVVLAELTTIAHLTGVRGPEALRLPSPAPDVLAAIRDMLGGGQECAISLACRAAANVRSPAIWRDVDSGSLAQHCALKVREMLDDDHIGCRDDEREYRSGLFLLLPILQSLIEWTEAGHPGPHPDMVQWRLDYRLDLEVDDPVGAVNDLMPATNWSDHHRVLWGIDQPSALAVALKFGRPSPQQDALARFGLREDELLAKLLQGRR